MYYISAVKTWFVQWTRRIVLMKTLKIVFKKKKTVFATVQKNSVVCTLFDSIS